MTQWILWLCLTTAVGGACQTEKRWPTVNRYECMEQLRAMRIEPSFGAITIGEATSVELAASAPGRTIAACVQEPKP